ncbi:hypothetical protein F4678DRAFT_477170 [Xylaria arbuscula]|nr:hypothetical protein F4678DRAFT_477170 [Xylaria arbuscula]
MPELSKAIRQYGESFLQTHPSCIKEIVCVFIGGSRLYSDEQLGSSHSAQQKDYDGIVVVNSKHEMYSLVSDKRRRQLILNMAGIEHEEQPDLEIPSVESPLYHEFDAIRIAGYDEAYIKRSIKLLSLEYFNQSKTSLNVLSGKDRRVYTDDTAASVQLSQATTIGGYVILHDQWTYASNENDLVTFGITTDLLLSAACVYGELPYGQDIKRMLTEHYTSALGSFPGVKSFAKSLRFFPSYTEWLRGELAGLCPTSLETDLHHGRKGGKKAFLFGNVFQTRANVVLCNSMYTKRLHIEAARQFDRGEVSRQESHRPQFSNNSTSYIVKTKFPGDIFDIFVKVSEHAQEELKGAKTASRFFPRTAIPCMASSGELLYQFFHGTTQSDVRLSYIRGGRLDASLMEKLLYIELVKAEDTLRSYRSSLSLERRSPHRRYNIQRFFLDRLLNDRRMKDHYGQGMTLGGKALSLDKLLSLRWHINGKLYPSLREAFDEARDTMSPNSTQMSSCPIIFGLGDAHGGNVMVDKSRAKGGTSEVLFIDYEVAGFHPVMVDLAKPFYNDLFYETLYQRLFPDKVNLGLKYRVSVDANMITLDFKPQIDPLTQALLDIKLRYLIKPFSDELQTQGVDLGDYVPLLSTAIFLCATAGISLAYSKQAFLTNFATGFILRGAQNWEEFASRLEELGFKPRAGLAI